MKDDEGSVEYQKIVEIVDEWGALMDALAEKIVLKADEEGLLALNSEHLGCKKRIEGFMKKYGYRDGIGWWISFSD